MAAGVSVLYSTTKSPFSWAVRLLTWSRWSHVGIISGGHVIEAHALHGVVKTPIHEAIESADQYLVELVPCSNPAGVLAAATRQIGKSYDWLALFGFLFRRDWQAIDKWFCSELVAWSFQAAGCPLFRAERLRRVTPEHLYMLPNDQGQSQIQPEGVTQ